MKIDMFSRLKQLMFFMFLLFASMTKASAVDIINSINGPTSITKGQNITVNIDYETRDKDLVFVLQEGKYPWKSYHTVRKHSNEDGRQIQFMVPNTIPNNTPLMYQAILTKKGKDWDDRVSVKYQEGVSLSIRKSSRDEIFSLQGPTSITKGQNITVNIDYETGDKDLVFVLQEGKYPWRSYHTVRKHSNEDGRQIQFMVPNTIPDNTPLMYQAILTKEGKSWNDKVSVKYQEGVSLDVGNADSDTNDKVDNIRPVITLIGASDVTIIKGDMYNEDGATANDNIDGDITKNIEISSNVDTSTVGIYTVKYNVSDSVGNKAVEVIRTVKVVNKIEEPTSGTIFIDGSNKKYSQLQDAVNAAKDGDTIVLGNGLYKAGVTVNTDNLTIKAATDAKNIVLSGEKSVVNWQYDSSKELYYASSPCSDVQMLFVNGAEKKAARYPKSGYLTVKDSPSKSKFSLRNFNMTNDDMKDSVAHIRMSQWRLASRRVKNYKYDYINLESEAISDYNTITPQYNVFFTQVISAIDANEEWAWNANKIYMKSDSEPQNVSVACSEYGIHLGARAKRITIDGVNITKIRGNGIDKDNDTRKSSNDDLIIKNNTISYVSGWGIKLRDFYKRYERLPADTIIQGNEIHHARTGGMRIFADNTLVDSNYIHDIGASKLNDDVLSFGDNFMLSGIFIENSSGAKISHNRVNNTGYNGISLSNFWHGWMSNGGRIVENNYVSNAMLALNDGAGIYAHIMKDHDEERGVEPERDIIRNNIVENCTGSFVGTNHPDSSNRAGEGIYLDDASSHVDVYGNTVIDATKSLFLNSGNYDITARNNTFISPFGQSIYLREINGKKKRNVFIHNNKILSGSKWSYQLILDSRVEELLMEINSNIFRVNSKVDVKYGYGSYVDSNSFANWKNHGYDEESTVITDSTKPVVLINPSLNNRTFDNLEGCRKFDNTPLYATSSSVEPYQSLVLFGCNNYAVGTYKNSN